MLDKIKIDVGDGHRRIANWSQLLLIMENLGDLTDMKKYACTGLKDKNNKDIYEGDKVRFYNSNHVKNGFGKWVECEIVYVEDEGMFCLKWPDGYINKYPIYSNKMEVI